VLPPARFPRPLAEPGWHQFDFQLAGIQQCAAHLILHCKGMLELHPNQQNWAGAGEVITVLREAAIAVTAAQADECDHFGPALLADLRARYDEAVRWGIITNQHRDWAGGNHPGYTLARRLATKADQVWIFTETSPCPGQTTPLNRPSRVRNDIKPSPGTGTR
jgi:transposase